MRLWLQNMRNKVPESGWTDCKLACISEQTFDGLIDMSNLAIAQITNEIGGCGSVQHGATDF